eukprot:13396955-Alexandrium_andersonii.AAC.1
MSRTSPTPSLSSLGSDPGSDLPQSPHVGRGPHRGNLEPWSTAACFGHPCDSDITPIRACAHDRSESVQACAAWKARCQRSVVGCADGEGRGWRVAGVWGQLARQPGHHGQHHPQHELRLGRD